MDTATCQRCGDEFSRDAAWKVICRACWEATHERAVCTQCGNTFMRDAAWKTICLTCWRAQTGRAPPPREDSADDIPPHVLRALIHLCHPDKHGNSDTSHRVTLWLLQQRKRNRRNAAS